MFGLLLLSTKRRLVRKHLFKKQRFHKPGKWQVAESFWREGPEVGGESDMAIFLA